MSPSPVYGARLLSGFGGQPHRGFKSRHLRRDKQKRRPGGRHPGGVAVSNANGDTPRVVQRLEALAYYNARHEARAGGGR